MHPLVLLSIVDHFNRVNLKQRSKRVVGALLGIIDLMQVKLSITPSKLLIVTQSHSNKILVNLASGS